MSLQNQSYKITNKRSVKSLNFAIGLDLVCVFIRSFSCSLPAFHTPFRMEHPNRLSKNSVFDRVFYM